MKEETANIVKIKANINGKIYRKGFVVPVNDLGEIIESKFDRYINMLGLSIKRSVERDAREEDINGTPIDPLDQAIKDINQFIEDGAIVIDTKPSDRAKRFDPVTGESCK